MSVSVVVGPFLTELTESHCPPVADIEVVKSRLPVSVTVAGLGA